MNPLIPYLADYGIADYEARGFLRAFCEYVNLVDCDGATHEQACQVLPIGGHRWRDACRDVYSLILDCPELYW